MTTQAELSRGIMRETRPQSLCARAVVDKRANCYRSRPGDLTAWCSACFETLIQRMRPEDYQMGEEIYPFIDHPASIEMIRVAMPNEVALIDEVIADLHQMDRDDADYLASLPG